MMQQWRRAWGPWDVHHLPTQPTQHSTRHCWGWGLKRSLWQAWAAGSRKGKLHVSVLAFTFPGATCPRLEVLFPAVGGRKYNRLCWGCFNYPRGQPEASPQDGAVQFAQPSPSSISRSGNSVLSWTLRSEP